ncbi:unnamed protein product [Durusdinium trenchii]|uniref:Uncharacterized protein n=1 Tax=Durusdinium trenchii TaxID=1381693 RepID=A0ABP0PUR5_9DINO
MSAVAFAAARGVHPVHVKPNQLNPSCRVASPSHFGQGKISHTVFVAATFVLTRTRGGLARRAQPEPKAPPKTKKGKSKRKPEFDASKELGVTEPMGFFDPLSFAPKDQETFFEYRACEIKHGRVAMMAALGAVTQHFVRLPGFEKTNWGEEMPSGINAAFNTPGTFGLVVLTLIAGVLEFTLWSEDPKKEPGNFGDPLGLGQYTEDMRNRELNNGRFAMVAITGIVVAELVTGKDAVQQLGL